MGKKEGPSALDSLEQKLYNPKEKIDTVTPHHVRDRHEKELPTSWSDDAPIIKATEDESGLSFGAKFLIGSLIVLVAVLSFAAWRVLSSRNIISEKNIDMELDMSHYVEGGESFPLTVSLYNRNQVPLEEATLTILYKKGSGAEDEEKKVQVKKSIGTIPPQQLVRQDFEVSVYGSESEARDITVKLEFKTSISDTLFSKTRVETIVIKSPPVSVGILGPDILSVGQEGVFTIIVKNNMATSTTPSLLMLILPSAFTLEGAEPKQSARGNIWPIGALEPGASSTVKVTGTLTGNQGEVATMRAIVGSVGGSASEIGIQYDSRAFDIALRTSPLLITSAMETERGTSEALRYGDRATLTFKYKNVSQETLHDASLLLKIAGDAALMKDIRTETGYYDSAAGTVSWDRGSLPALATLSPGSEGTVTVIIPVVTKGSNSPKLSVTMTGRATAQESNDVVSTLTKSYVVQGSASLSAKTQYKNSPFQNTGPIPPEVNVETTYTVHVTVSAQNALQNTKVSFVLPAYVTWRNVGAATSSITYDARSRTVTWSIGSIAAGKTLSNDIGVSVKPSQVHVNMSPYITGGIVLDADEVESRAHLRTTISGLTTQLSGEAWNVDPSIVRDR